MIGMVLSNRYKLLERIGEGGMALVFKAKDSLLGRTVAVKVLRPQFASDEEFVERFRREATSAASLSHPNVVNIYDVGQDEQTYFIVMEYVDGENLKDIIRARSPLSPVEATAIGRQIVEALDHAHRHDIVHRDVKPHNILVTREGRVKVTDFGIARAASKSTLTQTGMVMGSVHYFSPEQARGTSTGVQSDLYSVGVVLYEMVTGTVPFKGDTPISVALAHIQDEAQPVSTLISSVPPTMERVISKALIKDLDKRYDSAEAMLRDLYIAAAQAQEYANEDNMGATKVMPVPNLGAGNAHDNDNEPTLVRSREGRRSGDMGTGQRRWVKPTILTSVAVILVLLFGVMGSRLFLSKPEVRVPRFEGLSYEKAERKAEEAGLVLVKDGEAFDARVPENHIISQQPPVDRVVKKGRHILVVVSKGALKVVVPDVTGDALKEAEESIAQAELTVGERAGVHDPTVPQGFVVSQKPAAGEEVPKDSKVDLVLSKGPEPVRITVPNYIGLPLTEVERMLADAQSGLVRGKVASEPSETIDAGIIMDQYPEADTLVDKGQQVNFVVSSGSGDEGTIGQDDKPSVPSRFEVKGRIEDGPQEQEITIIVDDVLGTRTLYKEKHALGDYISYIVEARSPGTIRVLRDGRLWQTKSI